MKQFVYHLGKWNKETWYRQDDDSLSVSETFKSEGWFAVCDGGGDSRIVWELYENRKDNFWIVRIDTPERYCLIKVPDWSYLIQLLGELRQACGS